MAKPANRNTVDRCNLGDTDGRDGTRSANAPGRIADRLFRAIIRVPLSDDIALLEAHR